MKKLIILAALGGLLLGATLFIENRKRAKLAAVRQAAGCSRRAGNLILVLRTLPPNYLPRPLRVALLRDLEQFATLMIRSGHSSFQEEGRVAKAKAASFRALYGGEGQSRAVGAVATKQQVQRIRRASAYLHEYLARQVQRVPDYCEAPSQCLLEVQFGGDRAVADYYCHLARRSLEAKDPRRARLAFSRAADVLKPWANAVPMAQRQCEDCAQRAKQLADAGQGPAAGDSREWNQWQEATNWKKKPQYDRAD